MSNEPIRFELPANDEGLVEQFQTHIEPDSDVARLITLLPRKYRFAGYIGMLDYLFEELQATKKELEEMKNKKKKKGWFY